MRLSTDQLAIAREWISDCFDDVDAQELTDKEVEHGIQCHWDGGISDFLIVNS